MLAGDADWTVRDRLHAALASLAVDGAEDIHLDLTGLRFIDVCCVRELIALTERRSSVRLIVYNPPASLRRIAAILYPEAKIEIIETPRPGAGEANGSSARAISRVPPPVTRVRPSAPDITELVLAEHARITKLIEQLDSALMDAAPPRPGYEPELAWAALAGFLAFHVDAAREITYQALAGTGPDAVKAIVQASETDADIRAAVEEAQLSRPGSRAWYMAVQATCSAAKSHIARVESDPLPRYQGRTAAGARRALGGQWVGFMTARALDSSACLPRVRRTTSGMLGVGWLLARRMDVACNNGPDAGDL